MNREIKFRAWTLPECEMTYSDEYENLADFLFTQFPNMKPSGHELLMQFTGLKDKNGKEIYEGDVVRYDTGNIASHKIVYSVDGFKMKRILTNQLLPLRNSYNQCEIIGNIYENPELLNG